MFYYSAVAVFRAKFIPFVRLQMDGSGPQKGSMLVVSRCGRKLR